MDFDFVTAVAAFLGGLLSRGLWDAKPKKKKEPTLDERCEAIMVYLFQISFKGHGSLASDVSADDMIAYQRLLEEKHIERCKSTVGADIFTITEDGKRWVAYAAGNKK